MSNAFHFNSGKMVSFSFKKRENKPKYVLKDAKTKKHVSPPLYTYRQLSHLVGQQNPKLLKLRKKKHLTLDSSVYKPAAHSYRRRITDASQIITSSAGNGSGITE